MQLNPQIAQNGIVYHNHKSFIKNAKKMKMKKVEDERRYNQAWLMSQWGLNTDHESSMRINSSLS